MDNNGNGGGDEPGVNPGIIIGGIIGGMFIIGVIIANVVAARAIIVRRRPRRGKAGMIVTTPYVIVLCNDATDNGDNNAVVNLKTDKNRSQGTQSC